MAELASYVFGLKCIQCGRVQAVGGQEIHGLVFRLLQELNPELSGWLHKEKDKPFTLSSLRGITTAEPALAPGGEYRFRATALNAHMIGILEVLGRNWTGKEIQVGTARCIGSQVIPERPPWATSAHSPTRWDYRDLFNSSTSSPRLRFRFVSPTTFRQRGRQQLFPLPENVFGSLLDRWNRFSPLQMPESLREGMSELLVARYDLHTRLIPFRNYKMIGFVGQVEYQVPEGSNPIEAMALGCLARFAWFAGMGYKTTMGLGQTVPQSGQLSPQNELQAGSQDV